MQIEVVVIGGGHAGCEAAYAAASMGCQVALVTLDPSKIGLMSCNPAMGGLAKGQLIKEIDALGGLMGRITDAAAIQYRMLNTSKGPAVRSSRAQCDKPKYALEMQAFLSKVPNLCILSEEVVGVDLTAAGVVSAVRFRSGSRIKTRSVILTSGTFLKAVMHRGRDQEAGGRVGEKSAEGLSTILSDLGFRLRRLKTGTPPRLHRQSIDYKGMSVQPGDSKPQPFSFYWVPNPFPKLRQVDCYLTHTNSQTHDIIGENLGLSAMYSGAITGVGPRYCPSIEDKVKRFADKSSHQVFVEPEGLDTDEMYINGISNSLPNDIQEKFVRSIPGLEKAVFMKYGYAVEYDSVDARQLKATLESKDIPGFFCAGQVNGTSGYEEAGAQGILAGMNAALFIREESPFLLSRSDGYLGVMVDDLILKGSDEPYRMFTSRAEFRLLLREDNADLRLSEKSHQVGFLPDSSFSLFEKKKAEIAEIEKRLGGAHALPSQSDWFSKWRMPPIKDRISQKLLLRRTEVSWDALAELGFPVEEFSLAALEQVEIQNKYEGYIKRDRDLASRVANSEAHKIPAHLDFGLVDGLSNEIRKKLAETRPESIGQMARIQGVTPAAVANLLIFLKSPRMKEVNKAWTPSN